MTSRVPSVLLGALFLIGVGAAVFVADARATRQNERLLSELQQQRSVLDHLSERVKETEGRPLARALAIAPSAALEPAAVANEVAQKVAAALDERAEAARAKAEAEAEPTPENELAFVDASQALTRIVESKHWTENDKEAMRLGLSKVSPEQKAQLIQRMAIALNSGHVSIETQGPPL